MNAKMGPMAAANRTTTIVTAPSTMMPVTHPTYIFSCWLSHHRFSPSFRAVWSLMRGEPMCSGGQNLAQELNCADQPISFLVAHQNLAFAAFAGVRVNTPPLFKVYAVCVQ